MKNLINVINMILQQAQTYEQTLNSMVCHIKHGLNVDVCSIYLVANEELILVATDGLGDKSVGIVRLHFNKGIVGLIAESKKIINIEDSHKHQRFHYFRETEEEKFHGFLGVPLLDGKKLVGVLVLQKSQHSKFENKIVEEFVNLSKIITEWILEVNPIPIDHIIKQNQIKNQEVMEVD